LDPSSKTQHVSITKINWLILFKEIIAVYYENHTKHINTLCGQNIGLMNVKNGGIYLPLQFEGSNLYGDLEKKITFGRIIANEIETIESRHPFKFSNNELYLSKIRIVKFDNPNFALQQHKANGGHIVKLDSQPNR
jgi:hypothetical protein